MLNITGRKRTEERLSRSEARFRATFENAAVGLAHIAPDGSWLQVNGRLYEITGYSAEELLAKSFQDITHPSDLETDLAYVRYMLEGEIDSYCMEKRYLRKDGSFVWVKKTVGCVRKADKAVDYFIAVIVDISEQKLAEMAVRESEERLRLANMAAGIGTFSVDLEAGRTFYSPELAGILGFSGTEPAEIDAAFARVHRDDAPQARKLFQAAARGENGGHLKMDFRFVRPGGEVRWMTWIGRAHFREEPHGRVPFRIVGACLDITDRKRQEDRIDLLMLEVAHRSKNMLAIVQAIARQTAAAKPGDFLQRFGERLAALAASQDLIIKNECKGAGLYELVRSQLGHFQGLVDKRIELCGLPFLVSASAAQPVGMALHELATNAGKYGALSNESGRVQVSWSLEAGESGGETFVISWCERGGPPVEPPSRTGFGSIVLCRVAMESLGAQVELSYAPTGLVWRLQCPAGKVLESGGSISHR